MKGRHAEGAFLWLLLWLVVVLTPLVMCTYTFFCSLPLSNTHKSPNTLWQWWKAAWQWWCSRCIVSISSKEKRGRGVGYWPRWAMAERNGDCGCFVCVLLCCGWCCPIPGGSSQVCWAWIFSPKFHLNAPCHLANKNPSCVPYFVTRHKRNTPILDHNTPLKSRSVADVTDGVYELVHFQRRGIHKKENSISMEFQIFHSNIVFFIFKY